MTILFRKLRLRRLTSLPLAIEITLALLLKILLLWLLWHAFFAAPQTRKMRLPTSQVEQHLLTTPPSTTTEKHDDAR